MNRPSLIILCGIPGSGKTTYGEKYIKEYPNTIHLSSDKIRKELYGDESIQGNPNEVFAIMQKRAVEALNNGKSVVYDSTAVTRKDRAGIISACPKFVKIECHIVWAPIETCIERDAARERTVGKAVIDRMLKRFQAPFFDEGLDDVEIIWPEGWHLDAGDYAEQCFADMRIPHDNPHHTLNIADHCWESERYLLQKDNIDEDEDLIVAVAWHDVGKPYTKAFIDSKGNPCNEAHFYQHQCCGSWLSYGLPTGTPYVAWLISTHMDPFLNTKYYNKLPKYLKEQVDLLHEADKNAH